MYTFVEVFQAVGSRKLTYDDDVVDRLSHRYTVYIIVCFALVITTYQYVGEYTVSQYSLRCQDLKNGGSLSVIVYCMNLVFDTFTYPPLEVIF